MQPIQLDAAERRKRYEDFLLGLRALVNGEPDLIANLANVSAALKEAMPAASWVGFYILRAGELVLGPFQGKVACVRISMARGVCGTAAAEQRTIIVDDVRGFPGHIACDAGSRSEAVVPVVTGDRLLGVLDVDSYEPAAFDETDAAMLEQVASLVASLSSW